MESNHTAAPWLWDTSGRMSRNPMLVTPNRGKLIVMDFGRKGMQGATPRFASWPGMFDGSQRDRLGGILCDAKQFIDGDGHLAHPDAHLIRCAPTLLDALERLWSADPGSEEFAQARVHALATIAMAKQWRSNV